jgi:hypothetical protein
MSKPELFAEQHYRIFGAEPRRLSFEEWSEIFPHARESITELVGHRDILIYPVTTPDGEMLFHVEPAIVEHDELHGDNWHYDE